MLRLMGLISFYSPHSLQDVTRQVDGFLAKYNAVEVGAESGTKKIVYSIDDSLYCVETRYDDGPPYQAVIRASNVSALITNDEIAAWCAAHPILVGRTGDCKGW